jgi:hypothetical protein
MAINKRNQRSQPRRRGPPNGGDQYAVVIREPRQRFYQTLQTSTLVTSSVATISFNSNQLFGDLANTRNFQVMGYEVYFAPLNSPATTVSVQLQAISLASGTPTLFVASPQAWLSVADPVILRTHLNAAQKIYSNGADTDRIMGVTNLGNGGSVTIYFCIKAICMIMPDQLGM